MKKYNRLIAVILAVVMLTALVACGDTQAPAEPTPEPTPEPVATPEPTVDVPINYEYAASSSEIKGQENMLDAKAFDGKGFYASSWNEDEDGAFTPQLYYVDLTGNAVLLSYTPSKGMTNEDNWEGFETGSDLYGVLMNQEGNPVVVESVYSSGVDKGAKPEDEDYASHVNFESTLFIRNLDTQGNEVSAFEVNNEQGLAILGEHIRCDANGNYVFLTETGSIVVDSEGEISGTVDLNTPEDIITLSDGRLAVLCWEGENHILSVIDTDSMEASNSFPLSETTYSVYDGSSDFLFYFTDGLSFYGYNNDSGENEELFNWPEAGVNGYRISTVVSAEDGSFYAITNKYSFTDDSYSSDLVTIGRYPEGTAPKKNVLTLATFNPIDELIDEVVDYNREEAGNCIRIEVLNIGNSEEENLATLKEKAADADIIDLSGLPYYELAASGMLEDLNPFIESDDGLSRDNIIENILSQREVGGKLYSTISGFYMLMVSAPARVVGTTPGWDYSGYASVVNTMGEGTTPFDPSYTRETAIWETLYMNMDEFVDWENLTCEFNGNAFSNYRQLINSIPEAAHESKEEESARLNSGIQLLTRDNVFTYSDIASVGSSFSKDFCIIGFPVSEGVGNWINLDRSYAMKADSENKEAVWKFLRTYFTEEFQDGLDILASNSSSFTKALDAAKESGALEEDKAELLVSLVNSAKVLKPSEKIYSIVLRNYGNPAEIHKQVEEYLASIK